MAWIVGIVAALGVLGSAGAVALLVGLGVLRGLAPDEAGMAAVAGVLVLAALAGGAAGVRERGGAGAVLAATWGPLVLVVLAVRTWNAADAREAARTGLTSVFPAALAEPAVRLADRCFPEVTEAPPQRATFVPAPVRVQRPPEGSRADDEVVLPYEGAGHSLAVQVGLASTRGDDLEVGMLFDTGATLTTLDRATLRRLGIALPPNAPVIELRTANGPARVPIVRVPRLWIGGIAVENVTVGVCEPCADGRVAGLLGLNVTGRFLVTLDTQLQEITLVAREAPRGPVLDLQPWVGLDAEITRWPDGRLEAVVTARNEASRDVTGAVVRLSCGRGEEDGSENGDGWLAQLGDLPSGAQSDVTVRIPSSEAPDEGCDTWRVRLHAGRW